MTTDVSLDQFAHLKQPACDYLSQVYQIAHHLQDLKEALEELLFVIQTFLKSSQSMLDKQLIPVSDLEALHLCQSQVIEILKDSTQKLESFTGFETYAAALAKTEAAHG